MQWRAVTNDNDILRDGDMFRVWQADQTWTDWRRVEASIGSTLQEFAAGAHSVFRIQRCNAAVVVEVRMPVTEGGV